MVIFISSNFRRKILRFCELFFGPTRSKSSNKSREIPLSTRTLYVIDPGKPSPQGGVK